jgi:hypothetical protein
MDADLDRRPSAEQIRWFGLLMLAFCALLGIVLGVRFASLRVGAWLWGFGAAFAALYYAVRPLQLPLVLAWTGLTQPLGRAVTVVLLGIVYFLVLTPTGFVARLLGRDRLARRFDPQATSYWRRAPAASEPDRYLRQS